MHPKYQDSAALRNRNQGAPLKRFSNAVSRFRDKQQKTAIDPRAASVDANSDCKTPPASTMWLKANRTSAWILLGVSRRSINIFFGGV